MKGMMLSRLAVVVLVAACNAGRIGQPGGFAFGDDTAAVSSGPAPQVGDDFRGAGPMAGAPAATPAAGSSEVAYAPGTLRKLTVEQYENSVRDLLGQELQLPPEIVLESDVAQNGFYAVGASNATISPAAAEKLEQAAYALAAQALGGSRRAQLVGCTPAAVSDAACAQSFLAGLGRRAFRRPLTPEELGRYVAIAGEAAQALGDFYQGLEFAVAGLLQSPHFLFRVELGEADPGDTSRLRYSGFELASRLSYALWNTTPDAALLDAAEGGELSGPGLAEQAARLLADARAAKALDNFHSERLGLAELGTLNKDESLTGQLTDELRAAMRDDVLRTFAELTEKPGQDFLKVFDSRVAYVNAELSSLYGVSQPRDSMGGLTRTELPDDGQRLGFVGKPAFLALTAHSLDTSPTLRGKYLRERVLCQSIPAPPANVVPVLGEPDPNAPTMRDRLRVHATDPSCAGCHNQMDPLGLSLEHFDAVGRYRETDNGHALDTSGELDGIAFDGGAQLARLLRDDPRSAECLVRQAYRYTLGHVEDASEEPHIQQLLSEFVRSGHDLRALFQSVSSSDAFRYAAKETP